MLKLILTTLLLGLSIKMKAEQLPIMDTEEIVLLSDSSYGF